MTRISLSVLITLFIWDGTAYLQEITPEAVLLEVLHAELQNLELPRAECFMYEVNRELVATYEEKLPQALATLFAHPQSQALDNEVLEALFIEALDPRWQAELRFIQMHDSAEAPILASVSNFPCVYASHVMRSYSLYLLNHEEEYWFIGQTDTLLEDDAVRWVDDMGVILFDQPGSVLDHTYGVWRIDYERGEWIQTHEQLFAGRWFGRALLSVESHPDRLQVIFPQPAQFMPPCQFDLTPIDSDVQYLATDYIVVKTFVWEHSQYVEVETTTTVEAVWIIEVESKQRMLLDRWQGYCRN